MSKYLLRISVIAVSLLSFMAAGPTAVQAECDPNTTAGSIACGADGSAGVPGGGTPVNDLNHTITNIINLLSAAVGLIAVIMLIVGGFRYITSGGNAEGAKSAKNTIVYALIGLVIVALAQVIVRFVLDKATNTTS